MTRMLTIGVAVMLVVTGSASENKIAVYDLSAMPMLENNANVSTKKVMGEIGTFMLGEFRAGIKTTPHHHTHEQINIGLSGEFDIVSSSTPFRIAARRGVLMPPDVIHHNDVSGASAKPLEIEFQPVRRLDFPPERQKVTFPAAPDPRPMPDPARMTLDFSRESGDWERLPNGTRVKSATGKGVAVSAWEVSKSATRFFDLRLHVPGAEQFVFVLDGAVEARSGDQYRSAPTGALVVNPPNSRPLQIAAKGQAGATVLVFEATKLP